MTKNIDFSLVLPQRRRTSSLSEIIFIRYFSQTSHNSPLIAHHFPSFDCSQFGPRHGKGDAFSAYAPKKCHNIFGHNERLFIIFMFTSSALGHSKIYTENYCWWLSRRNLDLVQRRSILSGQAAWYTGNELHENIKWSPKVVLVNQATEFMDNYAGKLLFTEGVWCRWTDICNARWVLVVC